MPAADDLVGAAWLEAFGAPAAITRKGSLWVRGSSATYTHLDFADPNLGLGRLEAVGSSAHQVSFALGGHSPNGQPATFSRYYQYDEELGHCGRPLQTTLTNVLAHPPPRRRPRGAVRAENTTATGGREVYVLLRLTPTKRISRCDE